MNCTFLAGALALTLSCPATAGQVAAVKALAGAPAPAVTTWKKGFQLAWIHGSAAAPPPITCPQGSSYPDGCAGAPAGATVQHATFFTGYANQSGQSNYAYRPPWNVPGVDYAVGYYTAQGSLIDPSVSPPVGCSWNAGANTLECTGSGSLDISGYNFTDKRLRIQSGYTGTCTVEDSFFQTGASVDAAGGDLIRIDGGTTCNFVFQSNTMDMNGLTWVNLQTGITDLRVNSATTLYQYNAFLNTPAEWMNGGPAGAYLARFNYAEGYDHVSPQHSEFDLAPGAGQTVASVTFSYNTMLQPANAGDNVGVYGSTTQIYYSEGGANPSTYSSGSIDHNVWVTNTDAGTHPGGYANVSAGGFEAGGETFGTIAITANYIDPTGALSCYYLAPATGTWTWSGNVNLLNGGAENAFNSPCFGKASH